MPYFTLNDGSTRNMTHLELKELENTTNLRAIVYHANTPPTYKVSFENGDTGEFTRKGAKIYAAIKNTKINSGLPTLFCKHDIYSGYNPALGCEISSKTEYKRLLKEKGLVEMGNDSSYLNESERPSKYNFSDSDIKTACEMGASISDREGDALISGDL